MHNKTNSYVQNKFKTQISELNIRVRYLSSRLKLKAVELI